MSLPARVSRRAVLGCGLAAATAVSLSGCASGSQNPASTPGSGNTAESDPGAFPVTIKHTFGETAIDKAPAKVATLGWSDQDNVLALGVVPVGATALTWGGNAAQSTDWFDAALAAQGGPQPTRYDDTDGAPVEELAKLAPDLILATNSGITAEDDASPTTSLARSCNDDQDRTSALSGHRGDGHGGGATVTGLSPD